MTAPTTTAHAQQYLEAVARELADLPVEERTDLLEDLAMHLAALDQEDDDRPYAVRLGRPSEYAAELRSAAGLPERTSSLTVGHADAMQRIVQLGRRGVESAAAREIWRFLPQLRPAWWVMRGYLIVLLPNLIDPDGVRDFPVPAPAGSHLLGVVLVVLAIVGSVALGRRRLPKSAAAVVIAGNLVLAFGALVVLDMVPGRLERVVFVSSPASLDPFASPLRSRYGPVTDIYPYAADGTPLEGVLLFDQDGRPLHVAQQKWFADRCGRVLSQPRAADGVPVPYSYPQQYVLDPQGRTLDGLPAGPGQCQATRPRPAAPLPTFGPPNPLGAAPPADVATN